MVGQTISHYKILEKLGEGGMGVVYKAEDTQLRRTVALKFLSGAVENEEVRTRLIREAQASASLDHPNICPVYGIHEQDGETFIAMAYIDGPSLADRIRERPLPLDEALSIAAQIAEGLQEAHEKGIVHRDIKPQNIMLTAKGQLKIMDFGLAALAGRSKLTKSGMMLGTPAYMAPEQLEGKVVDRRADIWALGVVLYEMLTQRTPFEAEHEQAVAYGILTLEPEPATALRSGLPIEIDRVLAKALAKDPAQRYQHSDDLLVDMKSLQATEPSPVVTPPPQATPLRAATPKRQWIWPAVAAGLAVLASVAWLSPSSSPEAEASPVRKFGLYPPVDVSGYPYSANAAISPDGQYVAFVEAGDGGLWVRDFSQENARHIEGTIGARMPFWSPDSAAIGFVAEGELKRTYLDGGSPVRICRLSGNLFGGGAWSPDGRTIVFTDRVPGALFEVPAGGGNPRPFLDAPTLGSILDEDLGYLGRPQFLQSESGADSVILTASRRTGRENRLVSYQPDSGAAKIIGLGDFPAYSPTGHLVYQTSFSSFELWAMPFDAQRMEPKGEPFLIAEEGRGPSVAADGTLVYASRSSSESERLAWLDRRGDLIETVGLEHEGISSPSLSTDNQLIGVVLREGTKLAAYVFDQRRRRLRLGGISRSSGLLWSRSNEILYAKVDSEDGVSNVIRQLTSDVEDVVSTGPGLVRARDWSPDGRHILAVSADRQTQWDIWLYERHQNEWERRPYLASEFDERLPQFSPSGQHVALVSNRSGRDEVYVATFPDPSQLVLVSVSGGTLPRWSPKGDELFFAQGGALMVTRFSTNPALDFEEPQRLFDHPAFTRDDGRPPMYDISGDGARILLVEGATDLSTRKPPLIVIQNWYEEFREPAQD